MKKKIFYSISCALLLVIGSSYCYLTRENAKLEKAHRALLQGYYQKCDEQLSKIKPKKLMYPLALFQGYSLLAQKNEEEAHFLFTRAAQESKAHSLLQLECQIAKACCYYQQKEFAKLTKILAEIDPEHQEHGWVTLLKAFSAFEAGDYQKAIYYLSSTNYEFLDEAQFATSWAKVLCKQCLTKEMVEISLGCSLIEENDCFLGRDILERLATSDERGRIQNIASLYLGYSYIKEADQIPLSQRSSFYQLAAFYFERSALSFLSLEQKELFFGRLQERAELFLQNDLFMEDPFFYLILPLQKWQAIEPLTSLAEATVTRLYKRLSLEDPFVSLLMSQLKDSLFHRLVNEQLTLFVLKEISHCEFDTLPQLLAFTEMLLPETALFRQKCQDVILSQLDRTILIDNDRLEQLQSYLHILKKMIHTEEGRLQLTTKLLEQSKILWQERGAEIKATRLMHFAFELTPDKATTKETIEYYLTALFDQAEACNLVERLSLIYDALLSFNLKAKRFVDPSVLANHVADAHYRFQTGQFSSSKALSSWVLKLDPNNQDALRLLGLNYYHLGDFESAIASLQKLLILDQDSYNALLLSEVISLSNQSHLVQIDNLDAFEVDK